MKNNNEKKIIVFANSGHGHFDLSAYDAYHNKRLENYNHTKIAIKKYLSTLSNI